MQHILKLTLEVLSALIIVFSVVVVGGMFLDIFKVKFDRDEKFIFSYAVGYGLLSHIVFILGVIGLYEKWAAWLIIFFIFTLRLLKKLLSRYQNGVGWRYYQGTSLARFLYGFVPKSLSGRVVFFVSLACVFVIFALSFVPPHYYDSLVYHLALPAEYIKNNSIKPLHFNLYSHFPQNAEMLFTLGLLIGDEITTNLLTFFTSVIFLLSIFVFIKKVTTSISNAWFGIFLVATTPFFMLLSPSTYVELHIAFFSFVSFWFFIKFLETLSLKLLFLLSIFCGFTIGVKYTGFATLLTINSLLLVFFLKEKLRHYRYIQDHRINPGTKNTLQPRFSTRLTQIENFKIPWLRSFFVLNFGAFISSFIWYAKNFIYTGNPVFPFFYNVFGYRNIDWNQQSAAGYFSMLTEYSHRSSVFYEIILLPYNLIFNPVRFGGGIDVLGDFGWVIFLCVSPLFLIMVGKIKNAGFMILYAAIIFAVWFFTKPVLRFLIPASGIFAVLSAMAIGILYKKINSVLKLSLVIFIASLTAINIYYFMYIVSFFRPWKVVSGQITRDEYLSSVLRHSPYPAFLFINKYLDSNAKIFFVGEQRSFYCKTKLVATNVFAPNPLVRWADSARTSDELLTKIKLQNFTHIFYNIPESERLRGYGIFNFTPQGLRNWLELLEKLELIFDYRGLRIYKL